MFEDLEITSPRPIVLGILGAAIAFFTASGGFMKGFNPPGGIFTKLVALILGGVVGFFWGLKTQE